MDLLYTKKFSKDLDTITDDRKIKDRLLEAIDQLKIAENRSAITGIKKLQGYSDYYRIRIGDYRLGVKISGNTIEMLRFLHRKEIYRRFP